MATCFHTNERFNRLIIVDVSGSKSPSDGLQQLQCSKLQVLNQREKGFMLTCNCKCNKKPCIFERYLNVTKCTLIN